MTELATITVDELKVTLFKQQQKNLVNFLWNEEKANKFLWAVVWCFQATPKLANCTKESLTSSFMKCAELNIYPSSTNGLAYVLPYDKKKKDWAQWVVDYSYAQFQLWYKWIVELFYRSWVKSISSEIVYQHDVDNGRYEELNGIITHRPDVFNQERRKTKAVGAYVIVELVNGWKLSKSMDKESILDMGKKFSKSFSSDSSPWKQENDPELWMWKKTVLKQIAKFVPQNETVMRAIEYDNEDTVDFEEVTKSNMLEHAKRESEADVSKLLTPPSSITDTP